MIRREILKILKSLSIGGSDKILLDLVIEGREREEKTGIYITVGCLLLLFGIALGWLTFGYLPTMRR